MKQVEIRLIGPDPKAKDLFYGVYQPADKALETKEQRLRESASTFSNHLELEPDLYGDNDDPEHCRYDSRAGFTVHHPWACDGLAACEEFPDITCPVEEFYKNQKLLTRLKMEPLRTLLFQNPKMAVYNELENAELVYSNK